MLHDLHLHKKIFPSYEKQDHGFTWKKGTEHQDLNAIMLQKNSVQNQKKLRIRIKKLANKIFFILY